MMTRTLLLKLEVLQVEMKLISSLETYLECIQDTQNNKDFHIIHHKEPSWKYFSKCQGQKAGQFCIQYIFKYICM